MSEIRKKFLDYFSRNRHQKVDSSNIVPNNDPTLMFTNSGMVQFKNVFTGIEKKSFKTATTSQKCIRAGGKHNDLENVGYTPRHHTFFEMLGNFSFGDYFKEKAIYYAWELLTKDFDIPKENLSATVFSEDEEAFKLWKKIAGLPESRIIKISTSDNFWSMGETGPCGPCSEIFYDHGDKLKGGPPGSPNQDGDRFIEIWNLVFMQFEQVSKEKRIDLPKPSVDTGMGLERITAVLQGTHDNYSIDHFKKLMLASSEITKTKIDKKTIASHRVIADHLRASSFLIAEGVLPSNEGRGYVLRRIMRRGMRHAHTLGSKNPIFYKLFDVLLSEMSKSYPELVIGKDLIVETLKNEEEKFSSLLDRGMKILTQNLPKVKNNTLPGQIAFKLYDTYGFPLDLTADILKNKNIKIDTNSFDKEMEKSKELARASWKGSGDKSVEEKWFKVREELNPTEFLGYEFDKAEGVILKLSKENKFVDNAKTGDEIEIITNQTPFYGESGGQVGDQGTIYSPNCKININDTQKKMGDLYVHSGKVESGSVKIGDSVNLEIDTEKRNNSKANHSATHLLHESLRRTLGKHVTQKGSLVSPNRLRFDYTHTQKMNSKEVESVEKMVNGNILKNVKLGTTVSSYDSAIKNGAIGLFGEKYEDDVRVVDIPGFSKELCGGTHVSRTGDIGLFKIVSDASLSSGVRRIEALTGEKCFDYLRANLDKVKSIQEILKCDEESVIDSVLTLKENNLKTVKINEKLMVQNQESIVQDMIGSCQEINGVGFAHKVIDGDVDENALSDQFRSLKKNKGILIAGLVRNNNPMIICSITDDLTDAYNANDIIKIAAKYIDGGGGGKKHFAKAGGKDVKMLKEAILKTKKEIFK